MASAFPHPDSRRPPPLPGGNKGGVKRNVLRPGLSGKGGRAVNRPAFSLLELMIGIMILGLGLVMVATMFPVAWHRARELNEYTIQKTAAAGAHDTVKSLVRVAGEFEPSSLAGDLILDPIAWQTNRRVRTVGQSLGAPWSDWPLDTRVHALNMENMLADTRAPVDEDPWTIENAANLESPLLELPQEFIDRSYATARVSLHERVYPPTTPFDPLVVGPGVAGPEKEHWFEKLDAGRFCWATFHRLKNPPVGPGGTIDRSMSTFTRSLDIYHVTLRRPQSTYRYARQDPATAPDPYVLTAAPVVVPAPRPNDEEVGLLFPVAWRVQVQFPPLLKLEHWDQLVDLPALEPTGIPTEIQVPPPNSPATTAQRVMMLQMFPRGAWFIDEITGEVFRVVKRRIAGANADSAFLTLDREVYLEELDLPEGDPRCSGCIPLVAPNYVLDPQELLRTVWVFPPQASTRVSGPHGDVLVFEGSQPVVEIDVRTLKLTPGE